MTALAVLLPVVFVLVALKGFSYDRMHYPFFKSAMMTTLAVLLPVVFVLVLVALVFRGCQYDDGAGLPVARQFYKPLLLDLH
jgi:hypothetical protein